MQNNILFDLIPLVGFFGVYYITRNIFMATMACIILSWIQVIWCKVKFKKIQKNLWLSTILVTVLGGLTVALHNKTFVMLKPTALFWIMGVSLLVAQFAGKNGIKALLASEIHLPNKVWTRINLAWAFYMIFLGALNLFVAFSFDEYVWVKFKVFGVTSLTLIFTILTGVYIFQHKIDEKPHSS